MAASITRRERQIGYAIIGLTGAAYLAIWSPVVLGRVKVPAKTAFLDTPAFAIPEGLALLAIAAFMIYRDKRRIAGAFAMLEALGAGWGNLVLLAFPLLAWGVFVGFKVDKAEVEARRQARMARRAAKSGTPSQLARHTPEASKRYTPPKRKPGRRKSG